MSELLDSPEQPPEITKDEVMAAYKKFVDQGLGDPAELPSDDPDAIAAGDIFDAWQAQENEKAEKNPELFGEVNLAKTMLHVDAGFRGESYLMDDVLDWLNQDLHNAESMGNAELAAKIHAAIQTVEGYL